jgi:hypothetical protein
MVTRRQTWSSWMSSASSSRSSPRYALAGVASAPSGDPRSCGHAEHRPMSASVQLLRICSQVSRSAYFARPVTSVREYRYPRWSPRACRRTSGRPACLLGVPQRGADCAAAHVGHPVPIDQPRQLLVKACCCPAFGPARRISSIAGLRGMGVCASGAGFLPGSGSHADPNGNARNM